MPKAGTLFAEAIAVEKSSSDPIGRLRPQGVSIIGIDPGASGGIALLQPMHGSPNSVQSTGMPDTERDIWEWLRTSLSSVNFAVIEQVSGYIGEKQPGSAMFKFGMSYGMLRGFLIAAGVQFEQATPQKWQKALGITSRKKEETKTQWKNRLKASAQQIFPDLKITLATADALLIAEYARRRWQEIK